MQSIEQPCVNKSSTRYEEFTKKKKNNSIPSRVLPSIGLLVSLLYRTSRTSGKYVTHKISSLPELYRTIPTPLSVRQSSRGEGFRYERPWPAVCRHCRNHHTIDVDADLKLEIRPRFAVARTQSKSVDWRDSLR